MLDTFLALCLLLLLGLAGFCAVWFTTGPKMSRKVDLIIEDVMVNGEAKWLITVTLDEQKNPVVKWERYNADQK